MNQSSKNHRKIFKMEKNDNTMVQNLWNATKGVLKGKLIAIQDYLKKKANLQQLNLHLEWLDTKKQCPKSEEEE